MPPPLIKARNISFTRNGLRILDNVSLELGAGDFITIIGPNGAGKTTLLKLLAGVETPDSGEVVRAKKLTIGYIPQRLQLEAGATMPMTVRRFLALGKTDGGGNLALHGDGEGGDDNGNGDGDSLAGDMGIAAMLETPLTALSGGEWQRLLLARALSRNPDLLLLDEPVQNLDVAGQLRFYALLDRVHKSRNIAVLMVSHDLHMVMASTRRVVCLYHHVCCSGAPEAVTRHPEFTRLFGREMAELMTVYRHSHDHSHDHPH